MADGDNFDKHGKRGWKSTARRFYDRDEGLEDSAFRSLRKLFKFESTAAYREIVDVLFNHLLQRQMTSDWRGDILGQLDHVATRHGGEISRGLIQIARDVAASPWTVHVSDADLSNKVRAEIGRSLLAGLVGLIVTTPGIVTSLFSGQDQYRLTRTQFQHCEEEGLRRLNRSDKVLRVAIEGLGFRPAEIMGKQLRTRPLKPSQRDLVHRPFNLEREERSHAAD